MNQDLNITDLHINDIVLHNCELHRVMGFNRTSPIAAPYEVFLRRHRDDSTAVIPVSYIEVYKMSRVFNAE